MSDNSLQGVFVHIVFFWLKNPENEADRAAFLKELNGYSQKIDVIKRLHIGTPADTDLRNISGRSSSRRDCVTAGRLRRCDIRGR